MADELTVAALIRKRADLAGRVEHMRSELETTLASLAALDATLRLFAPELRPQAIRPKPFPPLRGPEQPGMRVRDVLGALRETGRPMTTREIAERLLAGRAVGNDKLVSRGSEIVGAALRKLRARSTVTCEPGPGARGLWRLAGD
jgi:hypothetical protein